MIPRRKNPQMEFASPSRRHSERKATPAVVDLELRGIVAIRLVNASAVDCSHVVRSLGLGQTRELRGAPDIVIRYVDRLPRRPETRLLGIDQAAYDDGDFLVLQRRRGRQVRACLDLQTVGDGAVEIICERGGRVPLLVPLVNLTALARGFVPLHGSAFEYEGRGIVAAGWAKGGKTELLLAFMRRGATYVGDEWIYLSPAGEVYGLPEPIKLWSWHLDDLDDYRSRLTRSQRRKLRLTSAAHSLLQFGSSESVERTRAIAGRQRYVHARPETLFGQGSCKQRGTLDHVLFAVSHESDDIIVRPIDPDEVAARMAFSLSYERIPFVSAYLEYRFAFPDRRNALVEEAPRLERDRLAKALAGKPAHVVYHPFPAVIPDLFDAVRPVITR